MWGQTPPHAHTHTHQKKGLAETFLLPYNFKVWATPARLMNSVWVGERVATLNVRDIVANTLLKKAQASWGPNAMFRCAGLGWGNGVEAKKGAGMRTLALLSSNRAAITSA